MNGITLIPAPTIEQTPVAVKPARPISRARRGVCDIAGFYLFCLALSIIDAMNTTEMARTLGRKGGRARGQRLSVAEKKRIASLGGKARKQSLQAARRIADNFRYAAAVEELRGQPATVRRLSAFAGPLPGIYPAGL